MIAESCDHDAVHSKQHSRRFDEALLPMPLIPLSGDQASAALFALPTVLPDAAPPI